MDPPARVVPVENLRRVVDSGERRDLAGVARVMKITDIDDPANVEYQSLLEAEPSAAFFHELMDAETYLALRDDAPGRHFAFLIGRPRASASTSCADCRTSTSTTVSRSCRYSVTIESSYC
jgi:hypothetical protein